VWVIAGIVFVLQKLSDLHLLPATVMNKEAIWHLSIVIALGSIAVLYFATVFRNNMEHSDAAVLMHDDQEALLGRSS
jgi:hypothetical protein